MSAQRITRKVKKEQPIHLLGAVDLPARAESVATARAFVREVLGAAVWPESDQVELLVSELLSNAIRHSDSGGNVQGTVRLVLTQTCHALHVDVFDEGSTTPIPQIPAQVDPLSENGRGLWLVRELSSAWGSYQDETGRAVWFEIDK